MNDPRILCDDIKRELEKNILDLMHHEKKSADHIIDDWKIMGRLDELQSQLCEAWDNGCDEIIGRDGGGGE